MSLHRLFTMLLLTETPPLQFGYSSILMRTSPKGLFFLCFYPNLLDLADIHPMKIVFGVVGEQGRVEKRLFPKHIGVELAAEENGARFGGIECTVFMMDAGQSRCGEFIAVASALGAEIAQGSAIGFIEKGEGKAIVALGHGVGVALRTDEEIGNRLVPQHAHAAPAGGHCVVTGADQHPILADQLTGVSQFIGGDVLPGCEILTLFHA